MSLLSQGQRLALDQLNEIEGASDGALKITRVAVAVDGVGLVSAELVLDFPPEEVPSGGVTLERYENVTIHIPPSFPFAYPDVEVNPRPVRRAATRSVAPLDLPVSVRC
jgi:hypothetical protein